MLDILFKSVLLLSCVGNILTILMVLLKPVTKKIFSPMWHYGMWLGLITVMALPIRFEADKIENVVDIPMRARETVSVGKAIFHPVAETKILSIDLAELWLVVAAMIMLTKLISYFMFLYRMRKRGERITCPEIKRFTDSKIRIMRSTEIDSPLMLGLIKPTLILPMAKMTEKQLYYVLSHEMVHFKRQDIIFKWFVSFVKSVHWFNPVVYFISRQVNIECELSCDAVAVEKMDNIDKKRYAETILLFATTKYGKCPFTTAMAVGKSLLKKRILSISKLKKDRRLVRMFSAATVAISLVAAMTVSGIVSGYLLDKVEKRFVLTGEIPRIEFPTKLISKAQPEYQEETVSIEKGTSQKVITQPENIKTIKYSTDDRSTHYISLHPDENGIISIHFKSDVHDVPVEVNLYDSDRPGQGWEYRLPTNGQIYEFDGLDPRKTYTVEINTYCPGNYGIEGEAYIY